MLIFFNSKQYNITVESLFVEINQALREIWLFEHEFETKNLANSKFLGYQICQQTVHKIVKFHPHFELKSKREGKISSYT